MDLTLQKTDIQTNVSTWFSIVLYFSLPKILFFLIMFCRLFEYLETNGLNFPVIHHIEFPKSVNRYYEVLIKRCIDRPSLPLEITVPLFSCAYLS